MIKPSVDLRIVTRYQDIGTNAYCILFGCIDTANKSNFYINDTPKGSDTDKTKYLLCFYYSNRGANLGYIDRDTIVSCLVDKNLMMCYNNKTQTVVSRQFQDVSSININYSICLFGVNYSGVYSYTKPYRFWYCKLYNTVTGEVYRNMIPCVNNNNEYGMYDTISKLFFTSAIQGRYFTGEIL